MFAAQPQDIAFRGLPPRQSTPLRPMVFAMVFRLCLSAEKRWRRLNGAEQMTAVITGAKFQDGVLVEEDAA
jgi:hypothetical protein